MNTLLGRTLAHVAAVRATQAFHDGSDAVQAVFDKVGVTEENASVVLADAYRYAIGFYEVYDLTIEEACCEALELSTIEIKCDLVDALNDALTKVVIFVTLNGMTS